MVFHNFDDWSRLNIGYYLSRIHRNTLYSKDNVLYVALKEMWNPELQTIPPGTEYWVDPGTDPTAWQEVPKDCDNCYCKAMTIKTSGSTPDEEVTSCPYAVAHEAATQQAVPDVCQAWDPIEWPQLPPTPEPQLLRQAQNTNVHDDIDALFSGDAIDEKKQALRQRLRSGRIGRAEMQEILAKLI